MPRPIREIVGERVADLRHKHGLTQPELAKRAGTSTTALNRLERGHQTVSFEKLAQLADALGTTPDYLMGYSEERTRRSRPTGTKRSISVAV
jgi:UDP-N-acetylglucosamine 1-carboxyvinyltransferase